MTRRHAPEEPEEPEPELFAHFDAMLEKITFDKPKDDGWVIVSGERMTMAEFVKRYPEAT